MSTERSMGKQEKPFSPLLFVSVVMTTLGGYLGLAYLCFPQSFVMGLWFLGIFTSVHVLNAFAEYVFHRWFLHQPFLLRRPWVQHDIIHHHKHTLVSGADIEVEGLPRKLVNNDYAIEGETSEKHEASYFPWYTALVFLGLINIILLTPQILWPEVPILIAGDCAVVFSLMLYEFIHAGHHKPIAFWQKRFDHPQLGRFWKWFYGYHIRHHADPKCNMGISMVFGVLPLPDLIAKTWVNHGDVYVHGSIATAEAFESPRPVWPVRVVDNWIERVIQSRRKKRVLVTG